MKKLSRRGVGKERESRLLIAAVILLFLSVNLILSYLANTYSWYFLATDRQLYTLSGVTDDYFEKVNPDGKRVEFYFCMDEDGLRENNSYFRILDTVKQFEERYAFFSVQHVDIYSDFDKLNAFAKEHDTELTNQSVIVYSPDTGKSEIRSLATFYHFDAEDTSNDDMIFNGEEIVSALVGSVTLAARPTALFTTGHGEEATSSLLNALYCMGFDIETKDFANSEIPDDCQVVVIAAPKYDFEEYADPTIACEISRLRQFVREGGTVLYLRSAANGALPRLDAFYAELGIVCEEGILTDNTYAIDASGKAVLLRYDAGAAAEPVRAYAEKYNTSRLAAAGAASLQLKTVTGAVATPLLRTFSTAFRQVDGETVSTASPEGYTVAAISRTETYGGKQGSAVLLAAEAFADVDTMETDGYGNKEFLFSLFTHTTEKTGPIGCGVVLLNTYPLEDMTRGTANGYLIALAGGVPLCVAIVGVFVLRRRAHR